MKHHASLYEATVRDPAGCSRLSEAFYARVARDPVLRPLFPGKTLRCAIEEFAAFLTQFLGGPPEETQLRWWLSLRESHLRHAIGPREREAWLQNMRKALDDVPIDEPARGALQRFFEQSSAYLVNTASGNARGQPTGAATATAAAKATATATARATATPTVTATAEDRVEPSPHSLDEGLARCWQAQRALDAAVLAIRVGDADRAIALAGHPPLADYFDTRPAVQAGLLALMIRGSRWDSGGTHAWLEYVHQVLGRRPTLARERYSGRTLLHEAAITANLALVELLLTLGANPTAGVHAPLYCLGNEFKTPGAGAGDGAGVAVTNAVARVIAALVTAGADIDAKEGPKRCTALHMAARRDNVDVAVALLDCGADIESKDSTGDTPLRRAVNCNQPHVAALLLSRGADPHARGSKNLTPSRAARTAAMRRILNVQE